MKTSDILIFLLGLFIPPVYFLFPWQCDALPIIIFLISFTPILGQILVIIMFIQRQKVQERAVGYDKKVVEELTMAKY